MAIRHFSTRIDSRLGGILADLEGTLVGAAFKDRALSLATSTLLDDAIDRRAALRTQLWMLEWVGTDGLTLTAAGYVKPADVRAIAEVLPLMRDWIFRVTTEIHTQPVLYFREYLASAGLLRKYKGTLRVTQKGRSGLRDPDFLWTHLASTLIPSRTGFVRDASVVVLVHMGTTEGRIDVNEIASTMTTLGWARSSRSPIDQYDLHPVWNGLWSALGNVGERVEVEHYSRDRRLSPAAVAMIREALFTDSPRSW
jgi:hypothetical protein